MSLTKKLLIGSLILFLLSGCGASRKAAMTRATPEALYQSASQEYNRGRYSRAIELFQRLTEEHPLSELAIMAKLGIADSYFSNKQYVEAAQVYNEFIFLNPTNENVPYALYQLGLCHYNRIQSIDRDQTETVKAKIRFETLIARFPNSKFSRLAEKLLLDCNKRLAGREFYVGHFYFNSKKYKAALNRFQVIAREYPNLGFDDKVSYFIRESKRRLAAEEAKEAAAAKKVK